MTQQLIVTDARKRERSYKLSCLFPPSKPRVYLWPEDESVMDNFFRRWARPVKAYREVMPAVLKKAGLEDTVKFRWSQKAGCSCGCSPGFILQMSKYSNFDIHADIKVVEGVVK